MTLVELHDRLLAWAGVDERQPWLLAARRQHFARVGEPHEEDKGYEARMNGLLDHYLYDFRPNGIDTTLDLFLRDGAATSPPTSGPRCGARAQPACPRRGEEDQAWRGGRGGRLHRGRHEVVEHRAIVALTKGDILEARLLPHGGQLHFSASSIYHPREVRRAILQEVKRRAKAEGPGQRPDVGDFLAQLSRMALRLERYRNVQVESIYDFDAPPGRTAS